MTVIAQEAAETLALQALAWIVSEDDVLPQFLQASGAAPHEFASRATEAAFQIAVLDFLMNEDAWVVAFCDAARVPYHRVDQARQSLPGGARVHWT